MPSLNGWRTDPSLSMPAVVRDFYGPRTATDLALFHYNLRLGWSLQAVTATTLLKVPHEELRRAARDYPAIAEAFWRDCVVDASILSQWVVNVGRRDARMRLAHLLCELGVRMEQAGLGKRTAYQLHLTQQQLGDALGLTPVHVNRTLKSLRRDKLVATLHREMRILDWHRLVKLGEFDEGYLETGGNPVIHANGTP